MPFCRNPPQPTTTKLLTASRTSKTALNQVAGCMQPPCGKHTPSTVLHAAGWVLFMVFAGVGLVALPLDMIREFWGRPKATIPKSEYVKRARGLGVRANGIKVLLILPACVLASVGSLTSWLGRLLPCMALQDPARLELQAAAGPG